jgi:hypothetical protein
MKVGDKVRLKKWNDGSIGAGKAMGPIFTVAEIKDHECVDGVGGKDTMVILSDGTWTFMWNLISQEKEVL